MKKRLTLKLPVSEIKDIKKKAIDAGMTASEYVVWVCGRKERAYKQMAEMNNCTVEEIKEYKDNTFKTDIKHK